jgi:hypothetical protein
MNTRLLEKLLMAVAAGLFVWELGLGDIIRKAAAPSGPVNGCWVPITRNMVTSNGASFGWLYDQGLVSNTNLRASYEEAALADPDGDGFSSGAEYVAGTDARQSNSFFCVQSSGMVLSWSAVTGRVYEVLRTDRLTEAFTNAATIEYPTNTYAADSGFYRVHVRVK